MTKEFAVEMAAIADSRPSGSVLSRSRLSLVAICLLPVLLGFPFWGGVLDPDEGVYGTIARGILDGQLPYRDYFDHKPPLIYGWYVAALTVFGDTPESPRILASLAWSATTFLVYLQARLVLREERDALVAAGIFATSSAMVSFYPVANTEVFMALPLLGSILAFTQAVRQDMDRRMLLLAGVLMGLAILTKPVAAWSLLAIVAYFASLRTGLGLHGRGVLSSAVPLIAGSASVVIATGALFAALGAFNDFFYANVTYNLSYSSDLSLIDRLDWLVIGARVFIPGAGPFILVTLVALRSKRIRDCFSNYRLTVLCLAGSALGVLTSGYMFGHYFVALFPFMAIMAAPVVVRWRSYIAFPHYAEDVGATKRMANTLFSLGGRLGLASGLLIGMLLVNLQMLPTLLSPGVNSYHQIAEFLRNETAPSDSVYIYGQGSQVYFLADREPASRYLYNSPLTFAESARMGLVHDVAQSKPKFIVHSTATNKGALVAPMFAEVRTLLDTNYVAELLLEDFVVYRRRE
jgi:4-amino-4-deoxy-L-arabinose transferase-like glycosyltransferase